MATAEHDDFDPDRLYDQFPRGDETGHGHEAGFNRYVRLNDRSLFTDEALQDPAITAFVDADFEVQFAQFKSSTRESEWALHKPHLTLRGEVEGIAIPDGTTDHPEHIGTFFINHHRTMARWKQSVIVMKDSTDAGQIVYKQEES
jgi:hypothetical protein